MEGPNQEDISPGPSRKKRKVKLPRWTKDEEAEEVTESEIEKEKPLDCKQLGENLAELHAKRQKDTKDMFDSIIKHAATGYRYLPDGTTEQVSNGESVSEYFRQRIF